MTDFTVAAAVICVALLVVIPLTGRGARVALNLKARRAGKKAESDRRAA